MSRPHEALKYAVDIVLCIDSTASMAHVLDDVKASALSFHERLLAEMRAKGKAISQLRLKVIAFRDFGDCAEDALEQTDFLMLPERSVEFDKFVHGLEADGGGDIPESGLEALALAVQAPWERGLDRRRHVVVLFTDAPAHPLGSPRQRAAATYPTSVPDSIDELFEQWGHARSQRSVMDNSAKRLLLFAPEISPWPEIADDWNNTLFFPSNAGEGLEEWEMGEIINTIANSL
ncbi:VWA domain-containing protein [Amycolatopsis sp. WAC 01416]|uniref:vWA domain-containing protein n=1 Tax=Amycolatopsis sp. WAC 01416 TaxID=2203196 RepID=UPI000F7B385A|nr:vWA domain-containing protein [Amycolatopsis sp. WAC 01416]RSN35504.1 VWA domain-containing protein [Amycolatopsis sp. WAC 01416]